MASRPRDRLFTSHGGYFTSPERNLSMSDPSLQLSRGPQADPKSSSASGLSGASSPASAPEKGAPLPPAGNLATGALKLIALFFMLADHLGAVVFTQVPELRILGRIAFPVYCWCMVVGFYRTRSVPKYLGRILLTGVLVQPLYAQVMNHRVASSSLLLSFYLGRPNIFLTLFLGLAALWGIREKKALSHLWAPALALALATVLKVDYGWRGVLFILLLYAARSSRPAIAAVMIAYFLFWGTEYSVTRSLFGIPVNLSALPAWLSQPLSSLMRLEAYGMLSLPLLLIPFRRDLRLPRWVSYGIYPAHLLLVWAAKLLFR